MKTKICTRYKKEFSINNFYKDKTHKDNLRSWCNTCTKLNTKEWQQKHPEKIKEFAKKSYKKRREIHSEYMKKYRKTERGKLVERKGALKFKYNMSFEDYDKLFNDQQGCCAICGKHQSKLKIKLCVDHNHKTGQIRGLLCSLCNFVFECFSNNYKEFNMYLTKNKEG